MADIVTKEDLENASIDAKDLGECVHGNETGIVTPRLGDPYPTLPAAIQTVISAGGFEPFLTETALLASVPTVSKKAAKALDTHKIWYWNGSSWVDTGLSELEQAKADATTKANTAKTEAIATAATDATAKANAAKSEAITAASSDATTKANAAKAEAIATAATDATTKANAAEDNAKNYADTKVANSDLTYYYMGGNLVDESVKTVVGKGIDGVNSYVGGASYTSKIFPVTGGETLYILNNKGTYLTSVGTGYLYYADDPDLVAGTPRITAINVDKTDPATGLAYRESVVPATAKFLVFNTQPGTIAWAIHKEAFSAEYGKGVKFVAGIKDAVVNELSVAANKDLAQGNTPTGELYIPENLIKNAYLNPSGVLALVGAEYRTLNLPVESGKTYYVKVPANQAYPFKAVFSSDKTTVQTASKKGDVTLIATKTPNVYKFKVPTGSGIVAMFMNVVAGDGFDITAMLSVQDVEFKDSKIGVYTKGLSRIGDFELIDAYARKRVIEKGDIASRLANKRVLAFGDSLTDVPVGGYVSYMGSVLDTVIQNCGSSGATTRRIADIVMGGAGFPRRDSSTGSVVWPDLNLSTAECATLMIGTNDSGGNSFGSIDTLPTGYITDYATPAEYWALFPNTFIGNIALFIEYLRLQSPEIEIHLISPPYMDSIEGTARITKMYSAFKAVAELYAVHLINATVECGISYKGMHKTKGIYTHDGIHLTPLGNKTLGNYLGHKVQSIS